MTDTDLAARPPRVPEPHFATVTREQVSRLVDDFYGEIRKDPRLGPVFDGVIGDNWPAHLARMKQFWRSVLLKTAEYSGRPVPAHMGIPDLREDDFRIWLETFETTANSVFEPEAAPHVVAAARRIAASLWLARFGSPFTQVPDWSR
ncbi:group III truncated hemoglobin [Oricola thermophila]|uniref:Group III truncated hemoglobin n=1 Tax=Oricola thermophila TaxID=2742145 RepID=A0A6N1V9M7_9HYPH|nr:group III truncated hemoglobin [Oricola thermophila]QKV17711.1 group III truncated hemoglobin [Oricola thermophila]